MQVQYNSQVQPSLAGPNVADITSPLLVGRISVEVAIQQVWRDIELMIAVGCCLVFAGSDDGYAVLAHQPADTAPLGRLLRNRLPGNGWPTFRPISFSSSVMRGLP